MIENFFKCSKHWAKTWFRNLTGRNFFGRFIGKTQFIRNATKFGNAKSQFENAKTQFSGYWLACINCLDGLDRRPKKTLTRRNSTYAENKVEIEALLSEENGENVGEGRDDEDDDGPSIEECKTFLASKNFFEQSAEAKELLEEMENKWMRYCTCHDQINVWCYAKYLVESGKIPIELCIEQAAAWL